MRRALIVDDLPESLLLLRTLLTHHDWSVDEATDGAAALTRIRQAQPDVIISDLRMPGMDGFALLRQMKSDRELRSIPFVVFTGTFKSADDRALALKLGADAFVLKSQESAELMKEITALTGARDKPDSANATEADLSGVITDYTAALTRKLDTKYLELELAVKTARDNEAHSHQILEVLPAAAYTCDVQGLITYANTRAASLWGRAPTLRDEAEALFGPVRHFARDGAPIAPEDSSAARALRGQAAPEREIVIQRADGSRRTVLAHANPLSDSLGRVVGAVNVLVDITDQADARIALRESQDRLLGIVNSAMDAIITIDRAERVVLFNPAAEKMFGYQAGEVLGQPLDPLIPAGKRSAHREGLRRFAESGESTRFVGRVGTISGIRKSGECFPIEASISQTATNGDRLFTVILRDITERVQAEQTLRESEERFRQVTEHIDEVFWLFDVGTQRIIYASPAFQRLWGFPPAEIYRDGHRWLRSIHRDDSARVAQHLEVLQQGSSQSIEYRIVRPDGSERWVRDRGVPIRRGDGSLFRIAGIAVDITSQRQLEENFRQAQKMEAVGQLAGGIAHDFNNLLTVIQMHGSLLAQRHDPELEESLQPMLEAAARAANLTRQLLTFSRRQVKESRPIDLADVVTNMVRLLRRVLGEDITLETVIPPDIPLVNADAGMIEQVVMNLAVNARDAMPQGGRMRIGLEILDITPARVASLPGILPGRFVRLTVTDSGCGIPAQTLPHIFEPFFTTKPIGHGTGLGLATVFGIAQQHGGWVDVESFVALGSSFHVYIPAPPPTAHPTKPAVEQKLAVPGGSERILLVEDEVHVRHVARSVLCRLGYEVVEAASAQDALIAWQQAPRPFDLLLTDIIMPGGMNGRELVETLHGLQPDLRVIFMSGYSDDIVTRRMQVSPGENLLQKPFRLDALGAIVRNTLDRAPSAGPDAA